MHHQFDLSLILACYNEHEIFQESLLQIIKVLDQANFTYEIILVDDASQDHTPQLIRQALGRYPTKHLSAYFHPTNRGRGATVSEGFQLAKGKIVGYIDLDLEIPAWHIPYFIQFLSRRFDAVIAHRVYDFNWRGLLRWFFSKGYIWLRQRFINLGIEDTEAGYKFFKRSKILPVLKLCQDKHWFWDTEIIARAIKAKLKLKVIPVAFIRRSDKTSTVKLLPDTIDYFFKLIRYRNILR